MVLVKRYVDCIISRQASGVVESQPFHGLEFRPIIVLHSLLNHQPSRFLSNPRLHFFESIHP